MSQTYNALLGINLKEAIRHQGEARKAYDRYCAHMNSYEFWKSRNKPNAAQWCLMVAVEDQTIQTIHARAAMRCMGIS